MDTRALWVGASALAFVWAGAAAAQTNPPVPARSAASPGADDVVPELVATAERREVSLQKAAIAATVLSGSDLVKKGVFTVDQLQFVVPSLRT